MNLTSAQGLSIKGSGQESRKQSFPNDILQPSQGHLINNTKDNKNNIFQINDKYTLKGTSTTANNTNIINASSNNGNTSNVTPTNIRPNDIKLITTNVFINNLNIHIKPQQQQQQQQQQQAHQQYIPTANKRIVGQNLNLNPNNSRVVKNSSPNKFNMNDDKYDDAKETKLNEINFEANRININNSTNHNNNNNNGNSNNGNVNNGNNSNKKDTGISNNKYEFNNTPNNKGNKLDKTSVLMGINQRGLYKPQDFIKANFSGLSKTPDYLNFVKNTNVSNTGYKTNLNNINNDGSKLFPGQQQKYLDNSSIILGQNTAYGPRTNVTVKRDPSPLSGVKMENINNLSMMDNSINGIGARSQPNKSPIQERNTYSTGTRTPLGMRPSSKHRKAPSYDAVRKQESSIKNPLTPSIDKIRKSIDQGDLHSSGLLPREDSVHNKPQNQFKFGLRTRPGVLHNGMKKINQDSYILLTNYGKKRERYLLGVCDGHGVNGHFVSNFVKETLPIFLASDPNFETDPKLSFVNAYELCHQKLIASDIDAKFSGSTSISLLIDGDRIISANVGDSRAVMAFHKKGWEYTQLSYDHKPNNITEAQRILRAGGRIEPFRDFDGNFVGPSRVWLMHQDIPGLAMSRSIGDLVASTVGVTSQPEIKEFRISPDDKFIIIASDGVWEFINCLEAIRIVAPFYELGDIEGACDNLLAQSLKRWGEEEEKIVDDITFILLFL